LKALPPLLLMGACLLLMSCASANRTIGETAADTLPTWLSGLPKDAPPRRGTPEYDAWMAQRAEEAARPKDKQ
jgi:hypothetical protein